MGCSFVLPGRYAVLYVKERSCYREGNFDLQEGVLYVEGGRNPFGLLPLAEIKSLIAIGEKWGRVPVFFIGLRFSLIARDPHKVLMKRLTAKYRRSIKRPLRF